MIDTPPHRLQEALGRDFRIDEELRSGSSRVFAAVEVELDRPVMITVLPSWKRCRRIVMRCLASDARERFRSAADLRDQLARLDLRT